MNGLAGTSALLRLAARRERIVLAVSALCLTALSVGSAKATVALYPNAGAAMRSLGPVLTSPTTMTMYGPATTTAIQGLSIFKTLLMGAVMLDVLVCVIVRRHTRVEEESGRLELLGASPVGRQAPLAAAVLVASLGTLVIAALAAIGLAAIGFPIVGSIAFGVAWAIAGFVMTGVAAVAAQLSSTARGASGWGFGALAALFLIRALGDTETAGPLQALHWLSPLGWVNQVFPYGHNRIWLLAPALVVTAGLVALAFVMLERRDLGAGLLHARPGKEHASRWLSGPVGLAWRLVRPGIVGWTVAFLLMGVAFGGLVSRVESMLGGPKVRQMLVQMGGMSGDQLAAGLAGVYGATMLRFLGVMAAAAGVGVVLHLATEERATRAENVLAAPTSRTRWMLGFVLPAVGGTAWLVAVAASLMGAVGHSAVPDAPTVSAMLQGAAETVPAAWTSVGLAVLLVGLSPRLAAYAWGALALTFGLGEFGRTMGLPGWVSEISPYGHVNAYPLGHWDWANVLVLSAISTALSVAGWVAYRARDAA